MFNNGEIIHHVRDALGSVLVIDERKHRVLTFNSIFEQSKIDRRTPHLPVHEYNRAMMLPAAFHMPARVTVLGLGGGALASAFHHLNPECTVHVVELRQIVVDVAREFFSLPQTDRMQVTVADARVALEQLPDASSDMILADLYNADRMSPAQSQRVFMDSCARVLTDDGWLALNYHRPPVPNDAWFRQLRKHFPVLLVFRSKTNNTVLYASRQPLEAINAKDPKLNALERTLPIGWRKLMAKVSRLE